ncbi:MAG TPA: hypothetical protein VKS24_12785 [Bradyrhizobium sp.]|nr:hypothetical protein [Bradyrhizobium sp.]
MQSQSSLWSAADRKLTVDRFAATVSLPSPPSAVTLKVRQTKSAAEENARNKIKSPGRPGFLTGFPY